MYLNWYNVYTLCYNPIYDTIRTAQCYRHGESAYKKFRFIQVNLGLIFKNREIRFQFVTAVAPPSLRLIDRQKTDKLNCIVASLQFNINLCKNYLYFVQ